MCGTSVASSASEQNSARESPVMTRTHLRRVGDLAHLEAKRPTRSAASASLQASRARTRPLKRLVRHLAEGVAVPARQARWQLRLFADRMHSNAVGSRLGSGEVRLNLSTVAGHRVMTV